MNRCIVPNLSHRPGVNPTPVLSISALYTCRCFTHFGASQDSRAGQASRN
ncbi:hypothetical protein [Pseudocitrobacter corydidari]